MSLITILRDARVTFGWVAFATLLLGMGVGIWGWRERTADEQLVGLRALDLAAPVLFGLLGARLLARDFERGVAEILGVRAWGFRRLVLSRSTTALGLAALMLVTPLVALAHRPDELAAATLSTGAAVAVTFALGGVVGAVLRSELAGALLPLAWSGLVSLFAADLPTSLPFALLQLHAYANGIATWQTVCLAQLCVSVLALLLLATAAPRLAAAAVVTRTI